MLVDVLLVIACCVLPGIFFLVKLQRAEDEPRKRFFQAVLAILYVVVPLISFGGDAGGLIGLLLMIGVTFRMILGMPQPGDEPPDPNEREPLPEDIVETRPRESKAVFLC